MNCKHCNTQLEETARFCSNCGKPVVEPEMTDCAASAEAMRGPEIQEKKKSAAGKVAMIVAAVVVAVALLVAVVTGMGGNSDVPAGEQTDPTEITAETDAVVEATVPADGDPNNVTCKGSYTFSDDEVQAAADTVVATMDGKELTVGQLQIYYWMEVVYFLQDYGSYVAYIGLDYTQPLDTQMCTISEEEMTWQQYFLGCALDSWTNYQAMTLEAENAGLEMDAEMRESMDSLPADIEATALSYELEDADALIRNNFGAGASIQSYVDFWELYYMGYTFYNHEYEKISVTEADVEAYFAENEEAYGENGITKDTEYANVRHILLMPQGGTTDEETGETTYTDAEWAACRASAQDILDQWLAGDATEESFAELANTHSEDGGSNTVGGLYEDIYVGQMVTAFNDWCFDPARVTGDYGLVQTEYGYHIMYYVSATENVWYTTAESDLLYELSSELTPAAVEKHPAEFDYSKMMLAFVNLGGE